MKKFLLASFVIPTIFCAAPALAQETSNNCHPAIVPEASDTEYVKLILPKKKGAAGYSGLAYVLAFVNNERARMGGSAYTARACTDPRKNYPDAVIFTVRVKGGCILLPVASGAGFNGRVDVPQAGKPRTEMPFFVPTGEREVVVAPPL